MRQFYNARERDFGALMRRTEGRCVAFPDQELPSGASPARCRVGFEVDLDGKVRLLVDRNIRYDGPSESVARWLQDGAIEMADAATMHRWIRRELEPTFAPASGDGPDPGRARAVRRAEDLTCLDEIELETPETEATHIDAAELEEVLKRSIRGQDAAVATLAGAVSRHLARPRPRRPLSALSIGATGVGKTATAQALPGALEELAPRSGYRFLRLDMNEFQERHRVSQLLGAPAGYIGHGDGSELIEALSEDGRVVVLFDEIDKAHPSVLRVLMNAMDAGRISGGSVGAADGAVDCRRAIFLFTSNLLDERQLERLQGRTSDDADPGEVQAACRRAVSAAGMRSELVGRLGTMLVYGPLDARARSEIVTLSVARVADEYGLNVQRVAPETVEALLGHVATTRFGARPDEYLVDRLLGASFAAAAQSRQLDVEVRGTGPFECVAPSTAA